MPNLPQHRLTRLRCQSRERRPLERDPRRSNQHSHIVVTNELTLGARTRQRSPRLRRPLCGVLLLPPPAMAHLPSALT